MKFLIVDDNKMMRETLGSIVAAEGDQIIECEDGGQALSLYRACHPDWVLMDISMKDVNGIEATEQITQVDPGARVVIVTDYEDRFFRRAAEDAGAYAFVSKENLKQVRVIIDRKGARV